MVTPYALRNLFGVVHRLLDFRAYLRVTLTKSDRSFLSPYSYLINAHVGRMSDVGATVLHFPLRLVIGRVRVCLLGVVETEGVGGVYVTQCQW